MRLIRHPNRGELTRAVQLGEVDRITAVRFDAIAGLAWDQRWSDHGTFVPERTQVTLDAIAARSRLVAKPQCAVLTGQLRGYRFQGAGRVGDRSVLAHFAAGVRFGQRNQQPRP
jgi:hypothetical protein